MNLALIPLLLAALVLAGADPAVDQVQLLLSGEHQISEQAGAVIVADAEVEIPVGAAVPGPIYVIGGVLVVKGTVAGDVTQLAGTVRVEAGARVDGELQHVAGTAMVSDQAQVGRHTTLDLAGVGTEGRGLLPLAVLTLLLAGLGWLLARRRPGAVGNVAAAIGGHPVITLTVGALVTLTALALMVFMAFTLVLLPLVVMAVLAGLAVLAYGVVGVGGLIGTRLPLEDQAVATGLGVVVAMIGLRLAGAIPLLGDLVVGGVLLVGVGAVLVTYLGVSPFRPDSFPEAAGP